VSLKEDKQNSTIVFYKYQRLHRDGIIKESISHLFIISEFAEIKDNNLNL